MEDVEAAPLYATLARVSDSTSLPDVYCDFCGEGEVVEAILAVGASEQLKGVAFYNVCPFCVQTIRLLEHRLREVLRRDYHIRSTPNEGVHVVLRSTWEPVFAESEEVTSG